ncbi:type II toxin-antitoxin system Phd/YefM family antitoxin [Neisseria sp.]|uniref:type II toxin-antitoxin system Phd/YefM family antitoxin n=1 Tax=Neisseria sp. TaxID=192066 RepID=UPI00359F439B
MQANIHDAKTNLSHLAKCAYEGQTVIIAKAGKPYVQLVPVEKSERKPGALLAKQPDLAFADNDYLGGDKEIEDLFGSSL